METNNLSVLRSRSQQVFSNRITKGTRDAYENKYAKILLWFNENCPTSLNEVFRSELNNFNGENINKHIKDLIIVSNIRPFDFNNFQIENFFLFINSLNKKNGEAFTFSGLSGYRASLFHLFKHFKEKLNESSEELMKDFFKGLKRTLNRELHNGVIQAHQGKRPLRFNLLCFLCRFMMNENLRYFSFLRTFILITWNLMCRANSTTTLRYSHLEWQEDSLAVYITAQKNDQDGSRGQLAKTIYANPFMPHICPILALALHFCSSPASSDGKVFPGDDQYARFRKAMDKIIKEEEVKDFFVHHGLNTADFGSHSLRKGSVTFVGGQPGGPSHSAICNRAGWKLPGVQSIYFQNEPGGDNFVGRVVAGLPLSSEKFAYRGPFFKEVNHETMELLHLLFEGYPQQLNGVLLNLLASLIYHYEWLKENLNGNHRFFKTVLCTTPRYMASQKKFVECRAPDEGDSFIVTGVPALVKTFLLLERNTKICLENRELIPGRVSQYLEENAYSAGQVTLGGVRTQMKSALEDFAKTYRVNTNENIQVSIASSTHSAGQYTTFSWGGSKKRALPEDFKFPNDASVNQMWLLWCFGNLQERTSPFREVLPFDVKDKNERKRLSDLKYLMLKFEERQRQLGLDPNTLNRVEAAQFLERELTNILPEVGKRASQFTWQTMVTLTRKEERKRRRLEQEQT